MPKVAQSCLCIYLYIYDVSTLLHVYMMLLPNKAVQEGDHKGEEDPTRRYSSSKDYSVGKGKGQSKGKGGVCQEQGSCQDQAETSSAKREDDGEQDDENEGEWEEAPSAPKPKRSRRKSGE